MDDLPAEPEAKRKEPWLTRLGKRARERAGPAAPLLDVASLLAAALYLSAFVHSSWPWPAEESWARPSPTVLLLLSVLCAFAWFGIRPRSLVLPLFALLLVPLRVVGFLDDSMEAVFDRPFEAADTGRLDALINVVNDLVDKGTLALVILSTGLAFGAGIFLAKQAFTIAFNVFVQLRYRLVFVGTVAALLALEVAAGGVLAEPLAFRTLSLMTSETESESLRNRLARSVSLEATEDPLAALKQRDVYLLFVASYGALAFESPHREALGRSFDALEAKLTEDGYSVRTHRLKAPTLGGMSARSYATLIAGATVDSPSDFEVLRHEQPATLARLFAASGYGTVRVMPGVRREGPREEHAYLGFGMLYRAWELGYQGPTFGWTFVPDQYVLDLVYRKDIEEAPGPLFISYELSGSRPPWREQAPYLDDWSTIDDGSVFDEAEARRYPVEGLALDGATAAWQAAIEHSLQVLGAYLVERYPDRQKPRGRGRSRYRPADPIFIVVGDHPPVAQVSGDDASRSVPVHIVSRDEAVLEPFEARGYETGLRPGTQGPLPVEGWLPAFYDDFGRESEAP
jgi:hypothetical protein